jgi:hypothetical protein
MLKSESDEDEKVGNERPVHFLRRPTVQEACHPFGCNAAIIVTEWWSNGIQVLRES